jgi:cysteine sulfinate desulfinase/cysteine desulfurase-like protein
VIQALGKVSTDQLAATVRLTLGKQNTKKEINFAISTIKKIVGEVVSKDSTSLKA